MPKKYLHYENPPPRRSGYYSWSYTTIITVYNGGCAGSPLSFVDNHSRQVEIRINDVNE
jgi:hypothetical protein